MPPYSPDFNPIEHHWTAIKNAIKNGIGYVSEDRKALGFIPALSVKENISLSSLVNFSKSWFVSSSIETDASSRLAKDLKINQDMLTIIHTPVSVSNIGQIPDIKFEHELYGKKLINFKCRPKLFLIKAFLVQLDRSLFFLLNPQ